MNEVNRLEIEIIFNNINYLIENKIENLSESSLLYLDKSIEFFTHLIESLNSLTYSTTAVNQNQSYVVFPNLKEVVSSVPNTPKKISEKDLSSLTKYFSSIIENIKELKRNPNNFYSSDNSSDLAYLTESIAEIHSESYQGNNFETIETFSNLHYLC